MQSSSIAVEIVSIYYYGATVYAYNRQLAKIVYI